eukprot:MONOS_3204.1-p1 / transcript=MONOS_3204.1 / gene=MONOS_3204 / organism=Monocercomonoides_exilis_PA203 / gene_product=Ser / transcript_product=Ser / location=Mono_scaffold00073:81606-82465(-) / protein_length=211 / sequence_SO=supercontig / SO=protein_coding / is_pseudo=false
MMLKRKFKNVFFTPGNHDIWIIDGIFEDSEKKIDALLNVCQEIGVKTKPEIVSGVWIVPLFSWYDSSFAQDVELSNEDIQLFKGWSDLYYCKWPHDSAPMKLYERNESFINEFDLMDASPIISFSHMVPRSELLPPYEGKRKFLKHVSGSRELEKQIRCLGSCVHCFGHTHVNKDVTIEGIRYVQNSLGSHKEGKVGEFEPRLVQVWPLPL